MNDEKRFTDNARAALAHAEVLARLGQFSLVETVHLLLAIAIQDGSVGAKVLSQFGVDADALRKAVDIKPGIVVTDADMSSMRFSGALRLAVQMAISLTAEFQHDTCGTVHLLFCLLSQRQSRAVKVLREQNINPDDIAMELGKYLRDESLDGVADDEEGAEFVEAGPSYGSRTNQKHSDLERFTTDLTRQAADGKLDPVIGRKREIDRIVTILSRRTKNNPILIGEAGVGKTAVVEGLAQRIANGEVPDFLADHRVLELDLAAMVAGTKYRGEFEDRLKRFVNEVEKNDKLIIFIDEVHLLVGAGSAEGTMDAANLLKPALSRGKFHLIGATTNDEYRKYIEKDAALTRRMQSVAIDQPNAKDTARILSGLLPKYEEYHHVKFSDETVNEIVRLSERYLTDRQQPDKAIDVMDETAARVHVATADNDQQREIRQYRSEITKLTADMEKAVSNEDYEHAALYKMRISQLKDKIDDLSKRQTASGEVAITMNDVATTVSKMTGVPLSQLERSEAAKLASLEKNLGKRIIGQSQAVSVVAQAIRRSRAGIGDPHRPIGSFIFLGPTGVGKTELAKVLAEEVFGSRDSLIKVDMSEYSERHTVARLVGAPAGYVGYDDGGQLTERVRRHPYSVVLFDEIEKAHPDVFNILLQILEDGVLTDGHGRKTDFRNCVIILTSNVGASEIASEAVGFAVRGDEQSRMASGDSQREVVMRALRNAMRPELLNRFDQIVLFNSLGNKELSAIFDLAIGDLNQRLADKGVALLISPKLKKWLIQQGSDTKYGARPLRRALQDNLERVIAEQLIAGKIRAGDVIKADLVAGKVVLAQQAEQSTSHRRRHRAAKA